jgi:hypothetical protein
MFLRMNELSRFQPGFHSGYRQWRYLLFLFTLWYSALCLAGDSTPVENDTQPTVAVEKHSQIISSKALKVKINNPFGDVRLRFGGYSSDMEVLAIAQNLDGKLKVVSRSTAQSDVIEVKPANKGSKPHQSRIDLVVMVPQGKSVEVRTDAGLVEAKGVRDALSIATGSGDVRLNKNKAALQVNTDSGNIAAVLAKGVTEKEQVFASKTGNVSVWVAENDAATVHMETSGDLITHFSLDVQRIPHAEPDKKAIATINGGGNRLLLKSRQGQVAIRAYPASQ